MEVSVSDDERTHRYLLHVDGAEAGYMDYRPHGELRTLRHTEVASEYKGRGLGSVLIRGALDDVRAQGLRVVPVCPFVQAFLGGHPEYLDLVEPHYRTAFGLPEPLSG